jgi:single-strand DNA-binding protein
MSDLNRAILIGRLTRDAELKQMESGTVILSFSIANNKTWKQNGENKSQVSYFNCVVWGKFGEAIAQYCKKGLKVAIEGRLQQDSWEDQDGKKRQSVKIVVDNFNFLSSKQDGSSTGAEEKESPASDHPFNDSDIPF